MTANPLALNLLRRDTLSESERAVVEEIVRSVQEAPADVELVSEGEAPTMSTVILSGFAARANFLRSGSRQLSAIHVPGDFIDLHSLLLARMDHSVVTMTRCTFAKVPHQMLRDLTVREPHLMRVLWLLTVVDAAISRRWLIAVGRLGSQGQIAHFLCEMYTRLRAVQLAADYRFELPLTQVELGDTMGLSAVHINRTLQQLRAERLIDWQGTSVTLLDWRGLVSLSEFDPAYLNLQPHPR